MESEEARNDTQATETDLEATLHAEVKLQEELIAVCVELAYPLFANTDSVLLPLKRFAMTNVQPNFSYPTWSTVDACSRIMT